MAGLSLIVFPTLIAIGVAKHLSTPYENRTEESKKISEILSSGFV